MNCEMIFMFEPFSLEIPITFIGRIAKFMVV
jgi:hypothetical protein